MQASNDFDLMVGDIEAVRRIVEADLHEWMHYNGTNTPRDEVREHIEVFQEYYDALSGDPSEVLARIKAVFDRIHGFTDQGLDDAAITQRILDEFPFVPDLYPLAHSKPWLNEIVNKTRVLSHRRRNAELETT